MLHRLAVLLCALALPAAAQSIEETEAWQRQDEYMKRSTDTTAAQCGAALKFEFDKSSWWSAKSTWTQSSPNALCSSVVEAVGSLCGSSDAAKKAVAAKLKFVRCGHGKFNQGLIAGGGLRITLNSDSANVGDEVKAYLRKNL